MLRLKNVRITAVEERASTKLKKNWTNLLELYGALR